MLIVEVLACRIVVLWAYARCLVGNGVYYLSSSKKFYGGVSGSEDCVLASTQSSSDGLLEILSAQCYSEK